jgi:outer membrane receptor protein involved in Fe transport
MSSELRLRRLACGLTAFAVLTMAAFVALPSIALAKDGDNAPKSFNVPAGEAAAALKAFSQQAGVEVIFPTDAAQGVRTNAVTGSLAPRAALERMVEGTGFEVVQDSKTGALGLRETAEAKNAASRTASVVETSSGEKAIQLEEVRVLGSRIRQTETEGPSPVSAYDREYIKSTGAFTLSDFLNQLPQTYSGIGSGRGSAPNELNPEFGQRTETSSPAFNFVLGSSAAPPAQTGVSGVSLRGLGSGSTLVLVDGRRASQSGAGNRGSDTRQGFVDLNTIPLGMVERVEVITDGASAIYGADAVAGVINIILKKNYSGTEINAGFRTAEHGGGRERNASILHGFTYGKLSGTVSIEYFDRQNLKASDRSFSKNQNHTAIPAGTVVSTGAVQFGRDFRLLWGYPAVIQASGGTVAGNFNAIPGIRVVLVPDGSTATPALGQFVSVTTPAPGQILVNASGQRRTNTASSLDLIPETERQGVNANLNYKFSDRLDAYAGFRTTENKSLMSAQLSANSVTGGFGTAAVQQAAFNPFNQNVQVGMILLEFGPESQRVRTLSDAANAGVRGKFGQSWQYDVSGTWENQKVRQITRNYNGAAFANMLNNADASLRFNPFIDSRASGAPSQAALLEGLAVYPSVRSESNARALDFSADGDLFNFWGGPVKAAFGASFRHDEVDSVSVAFSSAAVPVATSTTLAGGQDSKAVFAELSVPVVGKENSQPSNFLHRFELQLAGRSEEVGPFSKSVPKVGVTWAPFKSLLFRGSWSEGFRAPGVTEYLVVSPSFNSTLTDPRRTPPSTPGVVVSRGSNPNPSAEDSENTFAGLVYEPAFAKGLNIQANFYATTQKDVLQVLSAQTLVNNEALFPGRVTRAAPTPADQALNQPGLITAVSTIFANFGLVENRSADITVDYTLPWEDFGRWRLNFSASTTLKATRQLAPGQPPVILEDDTSSPPKWRINASLFWRKGNWNASAFLWYVDGFRSNSAGNNLVQNNVAVVYNPTPPATKLDLRAGYEFKDGVWRGYGKGLRVGVGVNNVFDREPPFSDTVWGFNAGIHSQLILGRAYEFSFSLPL